MLLLARALRFACTLGLARSLSWTILLLLLIATIAVATVVIAIPPVVVAVTAFLAPRLRRQDLNRAQKTFARRSRSDQGIVLERQMHYASIARRHRIELQ